MRLKTLIAIALLGGCIGSANARIISPDNSGDIFRAAAMLADDNFIGVADQLALIDPSALTPSEAEQAAWFRCRAAVHTEGSEAAELLRGFLARYGASAERYRAMMLLGDCLLADDPAGALAIYNNVDEGSLTEAEDCSLAYHKGYALLRLGDLERAEKLMYASRLDKEWRARADFYIGYINYVKKDYAKAKQFLGGADRGEMPGAMADFYLAQIYYAEGDYANALSAAEAVMNRRDIGEEFLAEAVRVAGESQFQTGDTKEGIKQLKRYAGMTDSPARSALYILGTSEFKTGKAAEAVEMLQRVVGEDDAMAQSAYLYIGQALMARGDRDAALLAFEKALKGSYDLDVQEAAFYNYAVAKFSGARVPFGSSVATFEEFLNRYPNSRYAPQVQEYLVEGYLTDGNYEGALASINRMTNPSAKVLDAKQKVLYALGARALATGDADRALGYLQEARRTGVRDRQTDAQIALATGEALARKGQHREAIEQFNRYMSDASANDVNRPVARYDVAYSYFAMKDYANAAKNFGQLTNVKTLPSAGDMQSVAFRVDVLNRLGDSRLYLGEYDTAKENYLKAYDLQKSAGDYPLYQIAAIEGYERKHKDRVATLNRLLEEFPGSSLVPDALLGMTESYIQLGDNENAIATYRRLVAEYPSTEQGRKGYLQMALTLLNSGRRSEAITAYKDVVTLYPSSDEARMAIDELKRIYAEDGALGEFVGWLATVDGAPALDVAEADRLTFEAAEKVWITEQNPSRLETYVADYPNGNFRVRALGYLIDNGVAKGNHRQVVEYAGEIVERYPDSSQAENALYAKAKAETALGMSEEALSSWAALEQRASSPQMLNAARAGIMRTARDLADHGRVIAAAEALLASSTLGADLQNEAQFARAYAMAQTGREAEATAIWEQLAANPTDYFGAKSAYYLAEYLFNNGRTEEARRRVEALIDSGTPHSYWLGRGFILLSDIYGREGKEFEAREYLRSLRENYPGKEADIFRMIDERLNK